PYTEKGSNGDEFDDSGLQSQAGDHDSRGRRADGGHDRARDMALGHRLVAARGATVVQSDGQGGRTTSLASVPADFSHSLMPGWAERLCKIYAFGCCLGKSARSSTRVVGVTIIHSSIVSASSVATTLRAPPIRLNVRSQSVQMHQL